MLAPVVFGMAIDGICDTWDKNCGVLGRCLNYDNDAFRLRLIGFSFAGDFLAFLCQVIALIYAKYTGCLDPPKKGEENQEEEEEKKKKDDSDSDRGKVKTRVEGENKCTEEPLLVLDRSVQKEHEVTVVCSDLAERDNGNRSTEKCEEKEDDKKESVHNGADGVDGVDKYTVNIDNNNDNINNSDHNVHHGVHEKAIDSEIADMPVAYEIEQCTLHQNGAPCENVKPEMIPPLAGLLGNGNSASVGYDFNFTLTIEKPNSSVASKIGQ